MTHLRIENQNSNVEIVNAAIILKLYNSALGIEENLEEGESLSDYVSLKGNLLADHAKLSAYNYLTGNLPDSNNKRFPNLTISIPLSGLYIDFADPVVRRRCIEIWGDENNEVTTNPTLRLSYMPNEPFARSTLNAAYGSDNCMIHTFDELSLITNLTGLNKTNFFNNLWSMTSIDLSNITSITGGYVFYGCTNLLNLGETSQITSIAGASNFENCYKISEFDLNPSITNIPNNTFKECRALRSIGLSNVTNIGRSAFLGCTSLTSIDLSNCTTMETSVFKGCTSLSSIDLSHATTIRASAFEGCTSLTSVDLSNIVTLEGSAGADSGPFKRCTAITSVILNPTLTQIPTNCFNGCTHLSTIDLSHITSFNLYCFYNCSALNSITSISSATSIGSEAFYGCSALNIELDLPNLNTLTYCAFKNSGITKIKSLGNITTLNSGSGTWEQTFGYCGNLTEVDLSTTTSLTTIQAGAFYNCTNLTTVKFPNSLTTIGNSAFEGCTALTSVNLNNCTTVGAAAFKGCTRLTTAVIGKLSSLSGDAFDWGRGIFVNCTALTTLDCGDVLLTIVFDTNSGAFSGTENLLTLIIRNTTPPTLNMDRALGLTLAEKLLSLGGPNVKIYVPDVSVYRADTNWAIFSDYLYNISALPSS